MTELTPEREALYALHRNVPRSALSMAAQLEYDRLRPGWEQGEGRPAAGELEAARLAWEQEWGPKRDSGPVIWHAVDRSGTTHTFRYRRGFHLFWGTSVVVTGVGLLAGLAATLAYPSSSWARGDGGISTSDSIWVTALGLLLIWLGIRLLRLGVLQIRAGKMTVRGYFRTRAVDASEIRAILLRGKDVGGENGHLRWRARVELTGGKGFWIDGFDCGRAGRPPKPDRAAILDEVRAFLGVRPDDRGQPETRLTQGGRAVAPVSVGQQPSESAPDPDVDGAELAGWVETREFETTRLRPCYDIDQVDGFLSAIRDTFLGIREPSLTPDEIRAKQFTTTWLRPGYEQLQVDAFLNEAESRLAAQVSARCGAPAAEPESAAAEAVQIRCPECGAESTDATQVCARCGAPAAQQRPVADAAADGPGDSIPLPHELVGQRTVRGSWRNALIIVGIATALLAVSGLIAGLESVGSSTSTPATSMRSPSTSPAVQLTEDQLQPGDCLVGSDLGLDTSNSWPDLVTAVPCTQPHIAEVFFAGNAWSQSLAYPGDGEVSMQAEDRCGSAFQAYVAGRLQYIAGFTYTYVTPDNSTWPSGDRLVVCVAYKWTPQYLGGAPVIYSIRGSHR